MTQDHPGHAHPHYPPGHYNRAFAIGIVLNVGFIAVEVVYGVMADSLALLADAGHNLSDVVGLLVAWGASRLSQWHPTAKHTYGFRRSSILAALLNALILMVAIGGIAWEAIRRLGQPSTPDAATIMGVAAVGVVINMATALLFLSGRKSDLNIRGAFLHMAADAAISAGVVVAGALIAYTGRHWIDPVVSLAIAAIIFAGTWGLFRESMNLALDAVPEHIDPAQVGHYLSGLPGVVDVHHLHIWGLSTTNVALTAHLVLARPDSNGDLLAQVRDELHRRFGIDHATLQMETTEAGTCLCRRCTL
jgi:cobalt-zinc-cadmium efflux system protein